MTLVDQSSGQDSIRPVPATFSLGDRYERLDGSVYLSGLQALVRLLLDRARIDRAAGSDVAAFVSGYEGSPLAGYDIELARRADLLAAHGIVHRPGLNEELAATAVSGTQLAGSTGHLRHDAVTGYWYGKAPGLDRATDAFRHANLIGTSPRGGAVAFVGDDAAAKSSSVPSSSEPALAELLMPTFDPADPTEVLSFGQHAVELSRASGLWSALKIATAVADGSATADLPPSWNPIYLGDLPAELKPHMHQPSAQLLGAQLAQLERSQHLIRLPIATEYIRRSGINRIQNRGPARLGLVAAGKTFVDLRHALRLLGIQSSDLESVGVRLLKLGAVFPIEPSVVREFAEGLADIVVVEDKRGYLEDGIKAILYGSANPPRIMGKRDAIGGTLFPPVGELDPDTVARGLARVADLPGATEWLERRPRERISLTIAPRMPYFCSGCPHNSSTKVLPGTLVGGGIGCHALVVLMPEQQVGKVIGACQMGGEGGHWLGIAPFVSEKHIVQNIGDGTFAHSGSLAVRAAIAAGVNVTYKLLHNSAVAMTGGQDVVGGLSLRQLIELLRSEGVARIVVTTDNPSTTRRAVGRGVDVRHRDETLSVQQELSTIPGTTVLIHDQECAAEMRRKRKRGTRPTPTARVMINERVCEGCGDCGTKSNCLSVQPVATEFGRKTKINQSSCNLDFSCLAGDCPSFLTVKPGSKQPATMGTTVTLVDPEPQFTSDRFTMRIAGVGGTGVVTVSQIVATAAVLDGLRVRALDQTGLAQKGGAVISDVTITAGDEPAASKLTANSCDLFLGCDLLVAAESRSLAVADPHRTIAVVSSTQTPTAAMVIDPSAGFPDDDKVIATIQTASADALLIDASAVAEAELGGEQCANMVLLGAAYQRGALPLTVASIETAINLNGASVQENLSAFALGRRLGQKPLRKDLHGALPSEASNVASHPMVAVVRADAGSELRRLLEIRVPDLVAYQNERYARRYVDVIESVRRAGSGTVGSDSLAEAVAIGLYKLMAYKDEYEVARLSLDPALRERVRRDFGEDARYAFRLHPPILRALGLRRKITLGRWFVPVFVVLRGIRQVRGTKLDPFGYAAVRRAERQLVRDYQAMIDAVVKRLTPGNHAIALELAALPDVVRGYEQLKLASIERYRERVDELMVDFDAA